MKNSIITVIYFVIGLISILLLNQSVFWTGFVAKALILPALMILFLVNINPRKSRMHLLMSAGLFFSWTGDVVLEFSKSNGNIFIIGLVCFLLAHIMYFTVFVITPGRNSLLSNRKYLHIPVIIYGLLLVFYLYAGLGEMKIPVILYATVILTMLAGAINRIEKVNKESYFLVLAGAIFFVLSDSVIAISKFRHQFSSSEFVIMSTYIVAQYLIVSGYIYQFRYDNPDHINL
jgi:uncharacterized membrane protein YhhN